MSGESRRSETGPGRGDFCGAEAVPGRGDFCGAEAVPGRGDFCGAEALGRPGGPTRVAMRPCCVGALLGAVPPVRPEFPPGCAFLRLLLAGPDRSLPAEPGSPLLAEAGHSLLADPGGPLLAEHGGAPVVEDEPVTADARSEVLR